MGTGTGTLLARVAASCLLLHVEILHATSPPLDVAAGFGVQKHTLLTTDGYFLDIFRLLSYEHVNVSQTEAANGKPAVVLWSGLGCTAGVWLPVFEDSLPNKLAKAGFDVWLANWRGTIYGHKHEKWSFDSREFWDFGWNENALYDVGDTLKYITKTTGQAKVQFIGHSMGSTVFIVLNALTSEFQDLISHGYLLAPAVYMAYVNDALASSRFLFPAYKILDCAIFNGRIPSRELLLPEIMGAICRWERTICYLSFKMNMGKSDYNETKVQAEFKVFPDDHSVKQQQQYVQQVRKVRTFKQLDYGRKRNMQRYGTRSPPPYNLTNIQCPVSLYVGTTDSLADLQVGSNSSLLLWLFNQWHVYHRALNLYQDAKDLCMDLPNVRRLYVTPYPAFGHADFVVGTHASSVYDDLLQHMQDDLYGSPPPSSSDRVCNGH